MQLDRNKNGSYTISEKAIGDIVSVVVNNIKNVYPAKKDKDFVTCKFNKQNELNVKIAVRIKKGIDIVKLCSKVQNEINDNILLMTSIEPKKIDIDIQGFETGK